MLTRENVLALMADLESHRVERTESFTKEDKFSEAVCAFANDLSGSGVPGYLMLGIRDNGTLAGLKVTDQLLKTLAELRSIGRIQPLPTLTVERFVFPEGDVAVVEVHPSDHPPVRFKGNIWVHIGPTRAIASAQEERILTERRIANARTFDLAPLREAGVNDLSLPLFAAYRQQAIALEIIEANHRSITDQLSSLRFYTHSNNGCVTVAGMILFGKNPRYYLPGNYVQYLRYPGNSATDVPEDQAEISGDLFSIVQEMEARLSGLLTRRLVQTSLLREQIRQNYPETALRELFLNALTHRDYASNTPVRFYVFENRIEIHSPGGLYGEVTPSTLRKRTSYRNPVIAEAMKEYGYVNRFGTGIQRADAAMRDNGNPPLEFEVDQSAFLVTLRKAEAND